MGNSILTKVESDKQLAAEKFHLYLYVYMEVKDHIGEHCDQSCVAKRFKDMTLSGKPDYSHMAKYKSGQMDILPHASNLIVIGCNNAWLTDSSKGLLDFNHWFYENDEGIKIEKHFEPYPLIFKNSAIHKRRLEWITNNYRTIQSLALAIYSINHNSIKKIDSEFLSFYNRIFKELFLVDLTDPDIDIDLSNLGCDIGWLNTGEEGGGYSDEPKQNNTNKSHPVSTIEDFNIEFNKLVRKHQSELLQLKNDFLEKLKNQQ